MAFSAIGQLCHLMQLPQIVKDAACETLKLIKDKKVARGRSPGAVHAACVYIACRQEGIERTFREVCGAAAGTTVREIGRVYTKVVESLEGIKAEMGQKHFSDEKVVARLVGTLALPPEFSRASRELTKRYRALMAEELQGMDPKTRPQPGTIATAGLWLALQLHGGVRAGLADLSRASSMAAETIEHAARLMFPHVRALAAGVASDFRREDAIRRVEARYPIDASINSMESKLGKMCADMGLGADVAAAAQQLLAALQQPEGAAYRAAYHAGAKRTALAASAVWLALQLKGGASAELGAAALVAKSGAAAEDLRVAARAVFPHVRELAAELPPAMRSPEALQRVEADHPRMLWLGTAAQLAPSVATAAAAAAAAADAPPPHAPTAAVASAAAAALEALRSGGGVAGLTADAAAPATAAAASYLLARLAGAAAPSLAHAAAAAHVDAAHVAVVVRGAFMHARTLAAELPAGTAVDQAALAQLEREFPPPAKPVPLAPAAPDAEGGAPRVAAPTFWVSDLASSEFF